LLKRRKKRQHLAGVGVVPPRWKTRKTLGRNPKPSVVVEAGHPPPLLAVAVA
jgi:hypothetical protein